jgi:FMN reductase
MATHGSPHRPLIVGIGGTTRAQSSTERALSMALQAAERDGAQTIHFAGPFLAGLPHYAPDAGRLEPPQLALVDAVRRADAVIVATPGYHSGISGLVKNALDTLEALRDDERPYLDGRAVGCIVTAYGSQAGGAVLGSLRATIHALRGWPTPYGAAINTLETPLGEFVHPRVIEQLGNVGRQATAFAFAFGHRARALEALHA